MYDGPKRQSMRGGLSTTNIHKIVISNLDFGVTSTDIQVWLKSLKSKIPLQYYVSFTNIRKCLFYFYV